VSSPVVGVSRVCLSVASIGHLVSPGDSSWRIHSVFAHACNFEFRDTLLTLVAPRASAGPTTLVLHTDPPCDLRKLFGVGEVVSCRAGAASVRRATVFFGDASVWWPRARRPLLAPHGIAANLKLAVERLAICRQTRSSSVDGGQGVATAAQLAQACRRLDRAAAVNGVDRLLGWGEGLTPAGDDFLVGHLAALTWLAGADHDRRRLVDELGSHIVAAASRTTPIAAQLLRQAVAGHFSAAIDDLRDALLCECRPSRVGDAIEQALAQGATSGADTVSGLLAALSAWLPSVAPAQ
jgi:Protein of unknown function (DUF2877)